MDCDNDGKRELNFVDLADRPSAIRCTIQPHKLLNEIVSNRLARDGIKEIPNGTVYQQVCQDGDVEAIRFIFELIKQYPEDDVDQQLTQAGTNAMASVLLGDYPEVLDEVIRNTGMGIAKDAIVKQTSKTDGVSGVEHDDDDDEKMYLGLTVKGRKRKDLAQHGSNQNNYGRSFEIPLLWHAVKHNSMRIAEYLLGPGPLAAYKAFAKSTKTPFAKQLQKTTDLDKQLPVLLGLVPNIRRETALTAAIAGASKEDALAVTKRLFALQPSQVKSYVQTRCAALCQPFYMVYLTLSPTTACSITT